MSKLRRIVGCSETHNAFNDEAVAYKLLNWLKVTPDDQGVIYWHVANFTPDMDKFEVLFAFQTCFMKWQTAFDAIEPIGRVIELKSTDDWHQSQIRLYFLDPGKRSQDIVISDGTTKTIENAFPFDGAQGVLAQRLHNSFDLYFDEGEQWSDIHKFEKEGDKYVLFVQLWQVAMHEIGHMLDIAHASDKTAIMFPTYDGEHTVITNDDMAGLTASFSKVKTDVKSKLNSITPVPGKIDCPDFPVKHIQDALPKGKGTYKKRQVSAIKQIVIHHTADNGTPESAAKYHIEFHGWPGIGYHFMIDKTGQIFQTNEIDTVSFNTLGQNTKSLGICLIGNFEIDEPSDKAIAAAKSLVSTLKAILGNVLVVGHRDRVQTLCPGKNLYDKISTINVN